MQSAVERKFPSAALTCLCYCAVSNMTKRPLSVTIVSWLFIVAGSVGLVYHLLPLMRLGEISRPEAVDLAVISFVRILAILAGVFMLRAANWARWLCLAWLGFHVVISFWHTSAEVIMHAVLLVVIAFVLFRPKANDYFSGGV